MGEKPGLEDELASDGGYRAQEAIFGRTISDAFRRSHARQLMRELDREWPAWRDDAVEGEPTLLNSWLDREGARERYKELNRVWPDWRNLPPESPEDSVDADADDDRGLFGWGSDLDRDPD